MGSINSILEQLTEALAQDDDITTWSMDHYGRPLTVREHLNPRVSPKQGDCPLAIIYAIRKSGGHGVREKVHVFGIDVVVYDTGQEETQDNVIRYTPARHVEALRALIVAAVQTWVNSQDYLIDTAVTEYHWIDQLPFVGASWDLVLVQKTTINADPVE